MTTSRITNDTDKVQGLVVVIGKTGFFGDIDKRKSESQHISLSSI